MMKFILGQVVRKKQIMKYLISGGTTAVVGLSSLYILTEFFGLWYLLSAVIAFILSFFTSFFLQKLWTFNDRSSHSTRWKMLQYLSIALVNIVLNTFLLYLFVEKLGLWYMLAQATIDIILATGSFFVYKFIIFKKEIKEDLFFCGNARPASLGEAGGKIKVLIATGIYPPDLGGPATILTELPGALIKKGIEVKVITYSDVALTAQEQREKMVYRISRKQCSLCRKAKYFWQMLELSFWADMIYATDTYSVGYFAYLIKKLINKKYIIRFAGDSAWEAAAANGWTEDYIVDFQEKKYGAKIEKLKQRRTKILIGADKLIAVSGFIAQIAVMIGVAKDKIRVIYNSVDFFGEQPQKTKPQFPTLVFAGRLIPWKGVEALLYVVAELKNDWPDIVFEVLGDGPQEFHLKEMARQLNVEQNVKFRGRVSEPESHKIFARSTIFVLNTNYEGLPHSVLNAMKSGLPVITTSIGGNVEVVQNEESGLLVSYNDKRAWLSAITRLLRDESLQAKFVANSRKTLEKFRWEDLVEKTVEVINQC